METDVDGSREGGGTKVAGMNERNKVQSRTMDVV